MIHKRNFIDPDDSDVHTLSIENLWMWAKRKICWQYRASRKLFLLYLHEFIYQNKLQNDDFFCCFSDIVADN